MHHHALAAIMFTDIQGYTALMQRDEASAITLRTRHRKVFNHATREFSGKILQYYGDGTLSIFKSANDAVRCAIEMQEAFRNEPVVPVRVGIHTGDIIESEEEIIGDSVNIASRIESMGVPGSILISDKVFDEIKNQDDIHTTFLGEFALKNVQRPIPVYSIANEGVVVPSVSALNRSKLSQTTGQQGNSGRIGKRQWMAGLVILMVVVVSAIVFFNPAITGKEAVALNSSSNGAILNSIAVMPFRNIGSDEEGEYFAQGVREEILNHLSRIEGIKVISRAALHEYSEADEHTDFIESKLPVSFFLTGSTRKIDKDIRLSVRLINALDNSQVWVENYDCEYRDIWATQSAIAQKVAGGMNVAIAPNVAEAIRAIPTEDPEAWDDFLKAAYYLREYISILNSEGSGEKLIKTARLLYNHAWSSVRKDTNFALGYAFLGYLYESTQPDSGLILANKAISMDSSISTSYYVRAECLLALERDTTQAIWDFEKAISKRPDLPLPYWHFAMYQRETGNIAEAVRLTYESLRRNPELWMQAQMMAALSWDYLNIGQSDNALFIIDKALVIDPDNIAFLVKKAHTERVIGRFEELRQTADLLLKIAPEERGLFEMGMYYYVKGDYENAVSYFDRYFLGEYPLAEYTSGHDYGYALMKVGRMEEANERFEEMLEILTWGNSESPNYERAKIHAALEHQDSAYHYLSLAVSGDVPWGMEQYMTRDPMLSSLRNQREFLRLVKLAGKNVEKKGTPLRKLEALGLIPENPADEFRFLQ